MAKQFDNLFLALTDFGNLYEAFRKAAKGKRSQAAAARFEMNLADELIRLQRDLLEGEWRPGAYHSFTIRDPKQRFKAINLRIFPFALSLSKGGRKNPTD